MSKYLDCASAFAETMRDKFIAPGDKDNHLLIIARDETSTVGGMMGRPKQVAQSLYGICMEDDNIRELVLRVAGEIIKSALLDSIGTIIGDEEDNNDDAD